MIIAGSDFLVMAKRFRSVLPLSNYGSRVTTRTSESVTPT
jgi:hypothetical protein